MNILFLERDRAVRRLVKDMLEKAGATLVEVDSAADWDAAPRSPTPAIAIVEVEGTDGCDLIARFHAGKASRPALIAIATEAGQAEGSRHAGADEVLIEPVAMTTLFEAIARYLPEA